MNDAKIRQAYMEDVNSAVLAAMEELHALNVIDSNDPATDKLFDALSAVLEKHFDYPDYASHN